MLSDRPAIEVVQLVKRFGEQLALDGVTFTLPRGRIVGLVGRNGSGKTTLLSTLHGLTLPTSGSATILGTGSAELGESTLARIGVVQQSHRFLPWMTGREHLDFVRSFYERWDGVREVRLVMAFDLDLHRRIGDLSPGDVQKIAIITGVCHRPEVLLLDEPAAALDPPSRETLLTLLVEILREDEPLIIVSSHVLDDIERLVDWILCLDRGRLVRNEALDDLQERYAEWRVVADEPLPTAFSEAWILDSRVEGRQAVLTVERAAEYRAGFEASHRATIDERPIRLSRMFRLWTDGRAPRGTNPGTDPGTNPGTNPGTSRGADR